MMTHFKQTNGVTVKIINGKLFGQPKGDFDPFKQQLEKLNQEVEKVQSSFEQLEQTSPYLIPQNQEFINSYKTAVNNALDRGFDFRQQAIDTKLSKMGLSNSSTALGVQVALAREKANAFAEAELKQAELAQGLKQQAIGNIMNRGK